MIWARLAAAVSKLGQLLDELEDLLLPYESIPRAHLYHHWSGPLRITEEAETTIGMLSTFTALSCMWHAHSTPIQTSSLTSPA